MKIYEWQNLEATEKQQLLQRPNCQYTQANLEKTKAIIQQVREEGDQALFDLTAKFDRVRLSTLKIKPAEFVAAESEVDAATKTAILFAKNQIETYHQAERPETMTVETQAGVLCERQVRPIECVGLYIPGGSAPLVSTVLMLGVPAQIAGCKQKILCTPPDHNGQIDCRLLIAAKACGIENIYKVGGAQAIAAMGYGTSSIPKVNKIIGPGNTWVMQAKMLIAEDPEGASMDMPAGPSEVLIIADAKANPIFVAADLLSQAEHGPDSQVMLITTSDVFAKAVSNAVINQLKQLPRYTIANAALQHSRIILVKTIEEAVQISNRYAPEHLILQVESYETFVPLIENAGAVFLGKWTPEAVGDYVTGSNHVLPTNGFARTYSGLSVRDFMKFIHFQTVSLTGLQKIGPFAEKLAMIEGLIGHKQAISLRLKEAENL